MLIWSLKCICKLNCEYYKTLLESPNQFLLRKMRLNKHLLSKMSFLKISARDTMN